MEQLDLSKLDAAKRQLEVAIKLYFNFDDPVSIHTLTAAAYNVLKDINKNRGNDPVYIKEWFPKHMIRQEKQKEFKILQNQAENFFKHAEKDPGAILFFRPSQTDFLLWETGSLYQRLTGEATPLIRLYRGWFIFHHIDYFELPDDDKNKYEHMRDIFSDRGKYFNELLEVAFKL
ncbi:MAG: hypothetical protein NT047_00930 [Deltaproteobacteria bacterium]|nr:hypothetical protein [Deltaproteobacteria bacterium]